MSDIFISYAREDRDRVKPLVRLLEDQGYSVWWDHELVPGASYEKVIDEAISAARCVVVVWSRESADSEWVQAEAGDGLERGILVPVMMDNVRVPISFRRKHAAQLLEWPKRRDSHEIEFFIRGIAECLDREPGLIGVAESSPIPYSVTSTSANTRSKLFAGVALTLALALAYVIYESGLPAESVIEPGILDYSIAVLPFTDPESTEVTSIKDVEARAEIAYEIAHTLRRIPDLRVISDAAVLGMLAEVEMEQIRRKLNVNYLIEGTLPNQATPGLITIRLVNTLSGVTLWTESFETADDSLSSIVSTTANRVANSLELAIPGEITRIPENAYLVYLKGRAERRKPHTAQARAAARGHFENAIVLAPQFGEAHAGVCRAYIDDYEITASPSDFEAAEKYCHRALTLDPNNNDVHIALGYLFYYSGQYERSLDSYRTVLASTPFNAEALRGMGVTYSDMGLTEKAERQFKLLIEIEPNFWDNYRKLGNLYWNTGRFTEAAANYEIQADLVRVKPPVLNNLAAAYYLAEQFDRAVDVWEAAVALEPNSMTYMNLGSVHFFLENFAGSATMYERAIELAPNDHNTWSSAAEAYYFSQTENYAEYYVKAIELANGQLAINPNDHFTLARIATYHSAIGHQDEALGALDKARSHSKGDVYVAYDAAIVYSRLSRKDETELALAELIEVGYSRRLIAMDANFRDYTYVLDREEP